MIFDRLRYQLRQAQVPAAGALAAAFEDGQTSMQKKQSDLVNPIFIKVGKAIEEVALENGYSYIINPQMIGGGDVLLFTDERYNVSNLVLKKLGIDLSKGPTTPTKKN
jgi:outer membrane protein